jgi:hypothetical protein
MSRCDHVTDGGKSSTPQGEFSKMKKIMSLMLGMSLVLGAASLAFGQDKTADDKSKSSSKKKGKTKTKSTDKKMDKKTT